MKATQKLELAIITNLHDCIDNYWNDSEIYGMIRLKRLNNNNKVEIIFPPKKDGRRIKANQVNGAYVHLHHNRVMYAGKSDSPSTSVGSRQRNHINSFINPEKPNESSGRKYHEYMVENDLQELEIVIKYIETSSTNINGMAELIESATIEKHKPLLNREIKGRGSRK
jgi:hypothetical protein